MNPVKELFIGLYAVTTVEGEIILHNMKHVWQVPYVPVLYIGLGCLIGWAVL